MDSRRDMSAVIDLTNYQFGHLRVVGRAGSTENHKALWQCECFCGDSVTVRGVDLISGQRRRCSVDCKFKADRPAYRVTTIDGRRGKIASRFSK